MAAANRLICVSGCRLTPLCLRPAVKKEYNSLMTRRKRISGKTERSTMQNKSVQGQGMLEGLILLLSHLISCESSCSQRPCCPGCGFSNMMGDMGVKRHHYSPCRCAFTSSHGVSLSFRFGVSLTTEGSSKAKVENGAREHSPAPGSDEDDEQLEPSKAATQMENTKNKNPGDQQACSPESEGQGVQGVTHACPVGVHVYACGLLSVAKSAAHRISFGDVCTCF